MVRSSIQTISSLPSLLSSKPARPISDCWPCISSPHQSTKCWERGPSSPNSSSPWYSWTWSPKNTRLSAVSSSLLVSTSLAWPPSSLEMSNNLTSPKYQLSYSDITSPGNPIDDPCTLHSGLSVGLRGETVSQISHRSTFLGWNEWYLRDPH